MAFNFERENPFDRQEAQQSSKAPFNWAALPVETLIKYRAEIDEHLPSISIDKMNLEQELVLQYHSTRALQNSVIDDETIPANQKAQVANSVAATLQKLIDMQEHVYNMERWKAVENLLIRSLSKWPEDKAAEFLAEYEKMLEKLHE